MTARKLFLLPLLLFLTGGLVQADEIKFQRIRTFDPVRGLIPGRGPDSLLAPALPPPKASPGEQSAPPKANNGPVNAVALPAQTTDQANPTAPANERSFANSLLAPAKPEKPALAPPDAPTRPPIPAIDANAALPSAGNGDVKPALSWRAKAYKLAALPDNPLDACKHPTIVFNASLEDSLNALAQACKSRGVQLLGKSIPAGQLGARLGDATSGRYLLIFVAKKISADRTLVKAGMEPDSRPQKAAILQDLLSQAASIAEGKGLL